MSSLSLSFTALWKVLCNLVLAMQYASEAHYVHDSTAHTVLPQFLQIVLALLVVSALCSLKFFPCPDFSRHGSQAPESDTEFKPEAVHYILSCQLHDLWSHSLHANQAFLTEKS